MKLHFVLLLALLSSTAFAGWNDLSFSSRENLMDARQGRLLNFSLNITNNGHTDGYAVYILNVTLHPPPCANNGQPVTSIGGILCAKDDLSCRNRFPDAGNSMSLVFTDLPTDANCSNGLQDYYFTLDGNSEMIGAESTWGRLRSSNTTTFRVRFVGQDSCGDSDCGGNESCATCPDDCGICTECTGGTRACVNNSVYLCVNGFYTYLADECRYGCEDTALGPACRRLCQEDEKRCAPDGTTLQTCLNNEWANETCARGCAENACVTNLCANVACPAYCENGRSYAYGSCNPQTGSCTYFESVECANGCIGAVCALPPSATPTPAPVPRGTSLSCCGAGFALIACCLLAFKVRK